MQMFLDEINSILIDSEFWSFLKEWSVLFKIFFEKSSSFSDDGGSFLVISNLLFEFIMSFTSFSI
jgi:hypothetical protein